MNMEHDWSALPRPVLAKILRTARGPRLIPGTNRYAPVSRAWLDASNYGDHQKDVNIFLDADNLSSAQLSSCTAWLQRHGASCVTQLCISALDTPCAPLVQRLAAFPSVFGAHLTSLELVGDNTLLPLAPHLQLLPSLRHLRASISFRARGVSVDERHQWQLEALQHRQQQLQQQQQHLDPHQLQQQLGIVQQQVERLLWLQDAVQEFIQQLPNGVAPEEDPTQVGMLCHGSGDPLVDPVNHLAALGGQLCPGLTSLHLAVNPWSAGQPFVAGIDPHLPMLLPCSLRELHLSTPGATLDCHLLVHLTSCTRITLKGGTAADLNTLAGPAMTALAAVELWGTHPDVEFEFQPEQLDILAPKLVGVWRCPPRLLPAAAFLPGWVDPGGPPAQLTALTALELRAPPQGWLASPELAVNPLTGVTSLQHLSIDTGGMPPGGEALEYVWLLQGLSSCSALRSLSLKGPISQEAHALVGQLSQLTSLDCAFDRFDQDLEPPREQLTLLQSLPQLQRLVTPHRVLRHSVTLLTGLVTLTQLVVKVDNLVPAADTRPAALRRLLQPLQGLLPALQHVHFQLPGYQLDAVELEDMRAAEQQQRVEVLWQQTRPAEKQQQQGAVDQQQQQQQQGAAEQQQQQQQKEAATSSDDAPPQFMFPRAVQQQVPSPLPGVRVTYQQRHKDWAHVHDLDTLLRPRPLRPLPHLAGVWEEVEAGDEQAAVGGEE